MFDYDCVVLSKEGMWRNYWDSETREYLKIPVENEEVFRRLRDACEIEDGMTLLDIMRIVESNDILKMFIGEFSWCPDIDDFHVQVNETIRSKEIDPDYDDNMEYLEVYWETHYHKNKSFSLSPGFHGWGYDPELEREGGYAIEFTPLYDLADYPVKLNKEIKVYVLDPKNTNVVFEGTQHYSLLDVLDAIYFEVSFVGGPEEVAEMRRSLMDTVEGIKSGEIETFPMPDFIEDLDDPDDDELRYFDFEEGIDDV